MNKLDMKTVSVAQGNIEKIRQLFPDAVTEVDKDGKTELAIDFDVLKQELSESLIEEGKERYQMMWPGKRQAIVLANTSTTDTLRPCKEESVDFDNTQNLYIEGDNLNVLKLLRETYLGKIKMIYIDPPYNTGNDSFVYNDCYSMNEEEFLKAGGYYDEDGNRVIDVKENKESNGRFHTDWLNMLYPRLRLARDLLTDDGVIFISIDDNELSNLIKICNEIFSESNFVGCICRATGTTTGQDANKIGSSLDYCLVYSKSVNFKIKGLELEDKDLKRFNEHDEHGAYSMLQLRKTGNADTREDRPNMFYPVIAPDGTNVYPFGPSNYLSRWRVSKESYDKLVQENLIVWKKSDSKENIEIDGFIKSNWIPYVKYYSEGRTKQVSNLFQNIEGNKKASLDLKELFDIKGIFNNPKPVEFIEILLKIATSINDLILDFFSGSATTAHAVMQLNAEDGGKRKFIMVQLPEKCDEKSEAYKAGYKNICEIGKERIRRAGRKIKEENGLTAQNLDIGFRVLKLDSSNMQDVYYNPAAVSQTLLDATIDNIKPDRTPLDLLFQVMLELGVPLSAKIEENAVNGKTYYAVNGNDIIACFDDDIDEEVITAIAKLQPLYAVFKDQSFASDSVAINNEQLFKTYSPATVIKVI